MSIDTTVPFATTLTIRDTCLCLHVQRAARVVGRRFDEALRPLGLTHGQFSLMNALNRPQPARIGAVAALLGMDRTTLTAALKPLERSGHVTMAVDPSDRRGRVLALTPSGHALLASAVPVWRATHAQVEQELAEGAANDLRRNLDRLSQHPSQ